ncbi:DUF998 domain-containing protein [Cognatiyoonia koreensis]|nr:DUF998 domain-containing protein [Cognatiyoonia koreensis]
MNVEHGRDMVMSYTRVRNALGVLGMLLPVFLIIGGVLDNERIEPTISDFYHTTYRDLFVGTLCAIGVFLISYRGYRREKGEFINDDWLATSAGIAAFGVALFPNESQTGQIATMTQANLGIDMTPVFHYSAALVFFSSLAAFCLVKFPRGAKLHRKRVYHWCGYTILLCLALTAIAAAFKNFYPGPIRDVVIANNLIFWFEAFGIWAFGLSWLVKGKADLMLVQAVHPKDDTALDEDHAAQ